MDMSVFSHLRWDFVYQRPQQIIGRMSKQYRTFYFEEPDNIEKEEYRKYHYSSKENEVNKVNYHHYLSEEGVTVIIPLLKMENMLNIDMLESIVKTVYEDFNIKEDIFWYYTPMALQYTFSFNPKVIIYDCMDQLSAFKFAPHNIIELENQLFKETDIVFTGGKSLYEAKKQSHDFVYCFPSSIDKNHFGKAKDQLQDPKDQTFIDQPRAGYFGVVDERFDIDLLRDLSNLMPNWNFIIIGPVVKINPEDLPKSENIYYLGLKKYEELPYYISNWDVAIMPFALNKSTEFISPTKTPEYLAAGKQIVSTAVYDVVHPYEDLGLVRIGRTSEEFADNIKNALDKNQEWSKSVKDYLKDFSWDKTCYQMNQIIKEKIAEEGDA